MENNYVKVPLLRSMGAIFKKSKKCNLSDEIFDELADDLKIISDYFNFTPFQSLMLSIMFNLTFRRDEVHIKDFVEYLDCTPSRLFEFTWDIDDLDKKGITITNTDSGNYNIRWMLSPKVIKTILSNKDAVTDYTFTSFENVIDLLQELEKQETHLINRIYTIPRFFNNFNKILKDNLSLPFISLLRSYGAEEEDNYLFLKLIWFRLNGNPRFDLSTYTHTVCSKATEELKYLQTFATRGNPLIVNDLITLKNGGFINEAEVELTDKSIDLLRTHGIEIMLEKPRNKRVILNESIRSKELFFNENETVELEMLRKSLEEKNLSKIRKKLVSKNLPTGINILLYGPPGTGKTETVMQIAKKTGRDIYRVDISETKSAYFGESEKVIKGIFNDYRELVKRCKKTPILLFNEADAVFSRRKNISLSSVAQTENAIQNIILEEMENLTGILMATTNLLDNLDEAFERRFLHKIELSQPTLEVKALIWKSKMPSLKERDCLVLGENFNLSGGEIDNILRKCETHSIIYGSKITLSKIQEFCQSEKYSKSSRRKIGFDRKL